MKLKISFDDVDDPIDQPRLNQPSRSFELHVIELYRCIVFGVDEDIIPV